MAPRRTYSINKKWHVLSQIKPNEFGFGLQATAKKNEVHVNTLRGWWRSKDSIKHMIDNPEYATKTIRRVPGGGRKTPFEDLERALLEWIKSQNERGLLVKDKYIISKALTFKETMLLSDPENVELQNFVASPGKSKKDC
jgi:hypothetical protein